jgi:hypothetical protein
MTGEGSDRHWVHASFQTMRNQSMPGVVRFSIIYPQGCKRWFPVAIAEIFRVDRSALDAGEN